MGIALAVILALTAVIVVFDRPLSVIDVLSIVFLVGCWFVALLFFRIPNRVFTEDEQQLIAPADGTICTIEETFEKEYLNSECLVVSIFMWGTDVHVNRYPAAGRVEYVKRHRGNYFVASYPKSSILNERASVGMRLENGDRILIRQVAGVMARRIACYAREGEEVKQNQELGFIRFGSRVDLFLPLGTEITVGLEDKVKNGVSPIGQLRKGKELAGDEPKD